jgi:hypothetical protein
MSPRTRLVVALLWIASLVAIGTLASAQGVQLNPRWRATPTVPEPAPIISGIDLGFRAEGWQGDARTGTFMVRIDGRWVEARGITRTIPATSR